MQRYEKKWTCKTKRVCFLRILESSIKMNGDALTPPPCGHPLKRGTPTGRRTYRMLYKPVLVVALRRDRRRPPSKGGRGDSTRTPAGKLIPIYKKPYLCMI